MDTHIVNLDFASKYSTTVAHINLVKFTKMLDSVGIEYKSYYTSCEIDKSKLSDKEFGLVKLLYNNI